MICDKKECSYCKGNHCFNSCNIFKNLKNKITDYNYCVSNFVEIPENDFKGFCSAGILLLNGKGKFLAIKEYREGRELWNLIGGKREEYHETPLCTALREFTEETGYYLSIRPESVKQTFWFSKSKYFLQRVEISDSFIKDNNKIKWFSISDYNELDFHKFASDMLRYCF